MFLFFYRVNLTDFSKIMLTLNLMPVTRFRQVVTGANKTTGTHKCGMLKKICLEPSTGKQVYW